VVVFLIGLYHAIICFTYPTPPSMLCPNPTNLSPQLFTWNIHTILCITSLLICGQVLLRSFIELGPSSNFQVEVPRQLVTTGLYSWAQHPSYTATFVIFLTNGAMILRRDGVAACWLQKSIVDGERLGMVLQTGYLFAAVVGGWMLATRVGDEEALLKTTFGTEWEVYHKRTKRFIPGIIWDDWTKRSWQHLPKLCNVYSLLLSSNTCPYDHTRAADCRDFIPLTSVLSKSSAFRWRAISLSTIGHNLSKQDTEGTTFSCPATPFFRNWAIAAARSTPTIGEPRRAVTYVTWGMKRFLRYNVKYMLCDIMASEMLGFYSENHWGRKEGRKEGQIDTLKHSLQSVYSTRLDTRNIIRIILFIKFEVLTLGI